MNQDMLISLDDDTLDQVAGGGLDLCGLVGGLVEFKVGVAKKVVGGALGLIGCTLDTAGQIVGEVAGALDCE